MPIINVGPGQEDNVRLGMMLLKYRETAGLSRAKAAKSLGFSSEYLRLIERGKRVPARSTAIKILDRYGVVYKLDGVRFIVVHGISIEFTSRILESREGRSVSQPTQNQSKRIGKIVELLIQADDDTISQVYQLLSKQ